MISEIFLAVYFFMIFCDGVVMINSVRKRDFILQNYLAYLIFFSNIAGIFAIIYSVIYLTYAITNVEVFISDLEIISLSFITILTIIKLWLDYKKLRKYFQMQRLIRVNNLEQY